MSPIEAYKLFLLEINKNDTNTNINVPKSQFVLLFNKQKRAYIDSLIKRLESSSEIEDIEELLVLDKKITVANSDLFTTTYKTPDDFSKRVSAKVLANKGNCKNIPLTVWFHKGKDINVLLENDNYNPSFEYRETIGILNNKHISVYKESFELGDLYLTYYREPKDLDISGYIRLDGQPSQDIETGLSKKTMEDIISNTVTETVMNYESIEQSQIGIQREQHNKQ